MLSWLSFGTEGIVLFREVQRWYLSLLLYQFFFKNLCFLFFFGIFGDEVFLKDLDIKPFEMDAIDGLCYVCAITI